MLFRPYGLFRPFPPTMASSRRKLIRLPNHVKMMSERSSPDQSLGQEIIKWIPYTVVALVGVTATVLFQTLGSLALAIVWLCVALGGVWLYALGKRMENIALRKQLSLMKTTNEIQSQPRVILPPPESFVTASEKRVEPEPKRSPPSSTKGIPVSILDATLSVPIGDDFAFLSKKIAKSTIEVTAECVSGKMFNFYVLKADEFRRMEGARRFAPLVGVSSVVSYRDSVRIPHLDEWYFVIEAIRAGGYPSVKILVRQVSEVKS